jgi:pyruvate dehydrogenase E2 component (dihydrolipoamide acetyltransferase)
MALVEVKVPDIGDFKEVEVIELLVKPGDTVKVEQSLLTVESDKASMEIPSSHAGVVKELRVKLGDKVAEGSLVLVLEVGEGAVALPVAAPSAAASSPPPPPSSVKEEGVKSASSVKEEGVKSASSVKEEGVKSASSVKEEGVKTTSLIEVLVPDIGDFDEVAVIEVMVKVGDAIKLEQSLITVESDKAAMEIPSSHAGVVKDVRVKVGDKVAKGSLVVVVEASGVTAPVAVVATTASVPDVVAAVAAPADRVVPTAALPAHQPTVLQTALPHASPSIRKLARELGVPLSEVKGTGLKSRITQDDVQSFVKNVMAGATQTEAQKSKAPTAQQAGGSFPGLLAWPSVDFAKFGPVERKDLSRIKKISGANLHRNWVLIPHVTNHDDADITDLEAFRVATNQENEKSGVKVTMLAFLIKASVAALKKFPDFNASLDGDAIVFKNYFHIGFAADTPNGLMVPVIKDADKKGVMQISQEMSELAKKARDGKLSPAEMSGGCFSISSLGGIGGRYFTPIINAPEVAIMGVCKSSMQPVWNGKEFQPRLMLPLSLSWDHRVIDGAAAARFNVYLASILADFRRVLL